MMIPYSNQFTGVNAVYIGGGTFTTNASSYDFGNFVIPYDGLVVAAFTAMGSDSRTVSSIDIGGTNSTINVSNTSADSKAAIASRRVAAGTHNVTVTLSATNGTVDEFGTGAAIGVFLLTGQASDTPNDTDIAAETTAAQSRSVTVDISDHGVAIFGGMFGRNVGSSWSSATEDADTGIASGAACVATFAHKAVTTAIAGHTETVTWSGGNDMCRMIGAAWV